MRTKNRKPATPFGAQLRGARTSRKINQRDLAKRLAIGQQAVSNWERGTSRPSAATVKAIADLFPEIPLATWLRSCGYRPGRSAPSPALPKPVKPLLDVLPMGELSFAEFQGFCAMLLRYRHEHEADVNQFGVEGNKQYGIDIEVRFRNNRYVGYQCKREKTFGKAKVQRAMKALKVRCDQAVILLSRRATTDARQALPKRSRKWKIWDSEDICRELRALPLLAQRRIIDVYFPAYRKDFLGLVQTSAVDPIDVYFAPLTRKENAFSHAWKLIGREAELAKLSSLLKKPVPNVSFLVGSGGVGKSRLAYEAARHYVERHPSHQAFVLAPGKALGQSDMDILAERPALVVIEDAHDHPDIESVLRVFSRTEITESRLLMVVRPYALSLLRGEAMRIGYAIDDESILKLSPLSIDASEQIAREILRTRNTNETMARQIAITTRGSPLFLVVGTHLVAAKKISPSVLNNVEEFQSTLLRSFRDVLMGDIGIGPDRDLLRDVLDLAALIQPFNIDSPNIETLAREALGKTPDKVKRAIRVLADAGVVVARGRMFRVTPDLLGEFVLQDRCVMGATGPSTGFIESVVPHADGRVLANILVNSSKLDWRIHAGGSAERQVADIAWNDVERRVIQEREASTSMLEAVSQAAYYHPRRALKFFDAVEHGLHTRRELARLLRHVAMNIEHLDDASERLWIMGLNDKRRLNQFPEHSHRILAELAEIAPGKPVEFCERVVDFALGKLKPGISPFELDRLLEILEAALKPEGHTTTSKGYSFVLNPYAVRLAAAKRMRRRVIDAFVELLRSDDLAVAVRVAGSLSHALRAPMNSTPDVLIQWQADFAVTLHQLRDLLLDAQLDPIVVVAILRAVHWHAEFGSGVAQAAAVEVTEAVGDSIRFLGTLVMVDSWGETRRERGRSALEGWRSEQREIAKKLVEALASPQDVVEFIAERLQAIQAAQAASSPGVLVGLVSEFDVRIADLICECALNERSSPLRAVFGDAVVALASRDPEDALARAEEGLAQDDDDLTLNIVWSYCWCLRSSDGGTEGERRLAISLVLHPNVNIAVTAIRAVGNFFSQAPSQCFEAFLTARFSESREIAEAVFQRLADKRESGPDPLTREMVERILDRLVISPDIDGYWTGRFLASVLSEHPDLFVEFATRRIDHEVSLGDNKNDYHALPYLWGDKSEHAPRKERVNPIWLRRVREWLLGAPRCHPVTWWGPKLYHAIRGPFDETVVEDLSEWAASRDPEKFGILADIMQGAPTEIVFDHPRFTALLLDNAYEISEQCGKDIETSLWIAATTGSRQGKPGEPFPEDVLLREKSTTLMETFSRSSPAYRLLEAIRRSAEKDIAQKLVDDEELFEE
jgi:DNA-binding XRE family transcriptional regulator